MMVLYGSVMDSHHPDGESIDQIIVQGGMTRARGAHDLRLQDKMPECPTAECIEYEDGSCYIVEVVLPHGEEELACYLVPEDQREGQGREWAIPSYVLRGCPARLIGFDLKRHTIGRGDEASPEEWRRALVGCGIPGRPSKCADCGTINPPSEHYCTRCGAETQEGEPTRPLLRAV